MFGARRDTSMTCTRPIVVTVPARSVSLRGRRGHAQDAAPDVSRRGGPSALSVGGRSRGQDAPVTHSSYAAWLAPDPDRERATNVVSAKAHVRHVARSRRRGERPTCGRSVTRRTHEVCGARSRPTARGGATNVLAATCPLFLRRHPLGIRSGERATTLFTATGSEADRRPLTQPTNTKEEPQWLTTRPSTRCC